MIREIRVAILVFITLTLITGVVYPLLVTAIAQTCFSHQANGSLITKDGVVIGSELIGQNFSDSKYFWGRPSATNPPYDAGASTGSNLGPTNPDLLKIINERLITIQNAHPDQTAAVPIDLVTASASGLDPHISPAAADYQIVRVAKARKTDASVVRQLVSENTQTRVLGVLGEPRVNVLKLNVALDAKR